MKINNNKGFTLIEVVVAFAVLAIISGTLLQMFVTSTKINQRAYETDKAHALVVKLLEEFKAMPDDASIAAFSELQGVNPDTNDPNFKKYTQYLKLDWTPSVDLASRVYKLEVVTSRPTTADNGEMSFYKEQPVYTFEFDPDLNGIYTLEVMNPVDLSNPDGDKSELLFQYNSALSNSLEIIYGNVNDGKVPVFLKANQFLGGSFTIMNKAQLTMDDGKYKAGGTPSDFELAVFLINVDEANAVFNKGTYSYSFIDTSMVKTSNKTMQVKVTRLSDKAVIADSTAGKYIVQKD